MTRLEALKELAKKVEEGISRPYEVEESAFEAWRHGVNGARRWEITSDVSKAYNGSLDAAKALHEAVLPGWSAWYETCVGISVRPIGAKIWQEPVPFTDNPARAWLLAILRALIAQEESA